MNALSKKIVSVALIAFGLVLLAKILLVERQVEQESHMQRSLPPAEGRKPVDDATMPTYVPARNCELVAGYAIGMSPEGVDAHRPNSAFKCRPSSNVAARNCPACLTCDQAIEIGSVPTAISFGFGPLGENEELSLASSARLTDMRGQFAADQYEVIETLLIQRFGNPLPSDCESDHDNAATERCESSASWATDGFLVSLRKSPDGLASFDIINADPNMSSCRK